jgi:hypothetical protein
MKLTSFFLALATDFADKEDLSTQSRDGARTPSPKERFATLGHCVYALRTPLENTIKSCGEGATR